MNEMNNWPMQSRVDNVAKVLYPDVLHVAILGLIPTHVGILPFLAMICHLTSSSSSSSSSPLGQSRPTAGKA